MPDNVTSSKFSVKITFDKADDWTIVAEVPGKEFIEGSTSGVLAVFISAPSMTAVVGRRRSTPELRSWLQSLWLVMR